MVFSSPSFLSEGARQIRLRGTLPLNIVEKQETTTPQPIDIKDGATIEQEGVTLQINKVETESRSTSFRYTVSYSNDSLLAGVVFLDQNGDKADSLFMGQGTLTSDGKHIEFQYHSWNKKYKTLKAAFIFNRNIKHINIPVDVTFGTP